MGPWRGADHGNVQSGELLQRGLHLEAVLAHDIAVIAAGVVQPVPVEVQLVVKQIAARGAKGAESVGGEEKLLAGLIGHHDLRPVDHGSHMEVEGMPAQGEGIPLLDGDSAPVQGKS